MELYMIRRSSAWNDMNEAQAAGEKSMQVGAEMADKVRWIRSYVVKEPDGRIGTFCVYEAVDGDAIREHAGAVGIPGDEFYSVITTIVAQPDPEQK